jgi:hypothetical protein
MKSGKLFVCASSSPAQTISARKIMTATIAWLAGVILFLTPTAAQAQPWSGIISSTRAVDWSGAGIPGGIPARTTVCATLSPGVTAAQINSAIAACPSDQVVKLNAGTYTLSDSIMFNNKSGVTLRGAGADQTKLKFTNSNPSQSCFGPPSNICFKNGELNYSAAPTHSANWTAGYAKGATSITLSSTTGLAVGNLLILDQVDDSSDSGNIYVCTSANCVYKPGNDFGRDGRTQSQIVKVTGVSGTTVTISPGLAMPNWRASQSPGAWWGNTTITKSGVEDLTVDATAGVSGASNGSIVFMNALNCWVKGVRSINGPRNHIWMRWSTQNVVRDSYIYGDQSSASTSYGIELAQTSDMLIENNLFQHQTAPMMVNGADTGSVFGYNYAIDDDFTGAPTPGSSPGWMQPMHVLHNGGIAMELYEGNQGLGIQADNVHGTSHMMTLFRNHYFGDIYNNPTKSANTMAVNFWAYSRFFNVVGNVLGRTGFYDTYEVNLGSKNSAVYSFGEPDAGSPAPADPRVKDTLLRWGNYDTVNAANRFVTAEVPAGISQFANPVPGSQSLPGSFYLGGKPAWFGSVTWPAAGPDVSGGDVTGYAGHAFKNPARLCYETTAVDSAYGSASVRLFNAAKCYAGGSQSTSAPRPPTNPRIIGQ